MLLNAPKAPSTWAVLSIPGSTSSTTSAKASNMLQQIHKGTSN
jgi:hypothetical protein